MRNCAWYGQGGGDAGGSDIGGSGGSVKIGGVVHGAIGCDRIGVQEYWWWRRRSRWRWW